MPAQTFNLPTRTSSTHIADTMDPNDHYQHTTVPKNPHDNILASQQATIERLQQEICSLNNQSARSTIKDIHQSLHFTQEQPRLQSSLDILERRALQARLRLS